ncbi:MAG: ion transporter [Saprospiraceae bacterium]|jgi:voltage-gated potassium channel|nr:ion transporter [Saprospiraceae bacterium]
MKIYTEKDKRKPENFSPFREKIHEIVFEAETPAGRLFDIILLIMILLSIIILMLETVPSLNAKWGSTFITLEWIITGFFTIEYIVRLYCVYKPLKYAGSILGIIDIASILPMYLDIFFPGAHTLMVMRGLRLLRVFRIFKLNTFINQGNLILAALRQSIPKMTVFLFFVLISVCLFGSIMYIVEHDANPKFDSIPTGIYWAIVTLTTVGYGDISPVTGMGKFISSIIMIIGYAVIAVPTGIVTSALIRPDKQHTAISCNNCGKEGHDTDATYCKFCGFLLD